MATDFFARQDAARRRTTLLLAYFALGVFGIVLAVYLAFALVFLVAGDRDRGAHGLEVLWNPSLFLPVMIGTIAVIGIASAGKMVSLAAGGAPVAESLGGRLVPQNTTDLEERRLLNIVEEMAIASGVPVPPVYILDDEEGINAFAAGNSPADAVVAVTRGTLRHLSRDELQGVMGHEFSHILNGDMRLNLRLIGLLFGILLIAIIGEWIVRSHYYSSSRKDSGKFWILGLLLLFIGWIGVFFGRLIKAGVSRQREFLADASAVQFTRNPDGIAGALKKIGGYAAGSKIGSPNAEQASHMFFGEGLSVSFDWLASHPPLEQRIQALDPSWDGHFPEVGPEDAIRVEAEAARDESTHRARVANLSGFAAGGTAAALSSVGRPGPEHLARASTLLNSFPDSVQAAAREPYGACAVVYATLLSPDPSVRRSQYERIGSLAPRGTAEAVRALEPDVDSLGAESRLPLVDLALASLRWLSEDQYKTFRTVVHALVQADNTVDMFEFALHRMLIRHLDRHFGLRKPPKIRHEELAEVLAPCFVVLAALARVGDDEAGPERAYTAAVQALGLPRSQPRLLDEGSSDLQAVDRALDELAASSPEVKRVVLKACAVCIAADGRITLEESELLRAIADALDCPMPPIAA